MLALLAMLAAAHGEEAEDLTLLREPPKMMQGGYVPDWIVRHRSGSAMTTEAFLRTTEGQQAFARFQDQQSKTLTQGVLLGVASTGIYAVGQGIAVAGALEERTDVVAAGYGVGFVGAAAFAIGAVSVFTRHSRRRKHPAYFLSATEADALLATYNAALDGQVPDAAPPEPSPAPEPAAAVAPVAAPPLALRTKTAPPRSGDGLDAVGAMQTALDGKEGALLRCFDSPGRVDASLKVLATGALTKVQATGADAAPCVAGVLRAMTTAKVEWPTRLEVSVEAVAAEP